MSKVNKVTIVSLSTLSLCLVGLIGSANAEAKCWSSQRLENSFGKNKDMSRCGGPLSSTDCNTLNTIALDQKILCKDATKWLNDKNLCAITFGKDLVGVCPRGCFEANTEISIFDEILGVTSIPAKEISPNHQLATLGTNSTLDSPELSSASIEKVVSGAEEPDLFVFQMEDGSELSVTSEHPMVLSDGSIVRAKSVVAGSYFVKSDGQEIQITDVLRRATGEDVFNFEAAGNATENHVIVANDVFVGDLDLQAESEAELASIELRK